jgi:hypothetical protein
MAVGRFRSPGGVGGSQARSGCERHGRSSPWREGEGKKTTAAGTLGFTRAPRPRLPSRSSGEPCVVAGPWAALRAKIRRRAGLRARAAREKRVWGEDDTR